ncbi:hypothetical protein HYW41_04505 [Candidatus Daviesbacteria bacterium]|nr:hypothetical protein [Candidatus Daviesbacteria bacterium]
MNKKEWLIAAILTFITICAWVIFDIIHIRSQVEIPAKIKEVIEPIEPNLNYSIFETSPLQPESP